MSSNLFCTYFDRNYLARGLSLIESLHQANQGNFKIVVVCMDELTRVLLNKLNIAQVITVPVHDLETSDLDLFACREDRSTTEYLWTMTPSVIRHIYRMFPEYDFLTYVDADLYFWQPESAIMTELGLNEVLIHGHNFPERLRYLEPHGLYNVGLISFKRGEVSEAVLDWWRERCIEWCFARVEDGKFGDQAYLDQWPDLFPNIRVSQNPAIGVAPWNHERFKISNDFNYVPLIDQKPIVFFHFHGLKLIAPGMILPCREDVYELNREVIQHVYAPYADSLLRAYFTLRSISPEFSFGFESGEHSLKVTDSFLINSGRLAEFQSLNLGYNEIQVSQNWFAAISPVLSQETQASTST